MSLPRCSAARGLRVSQWVLASAAFGLACRVHQYLANTSLWHDESFVALNVLHTNCADLLGARDWDEPSPPAFLLIEKLAVALLGPSEHALRLVPQLAGLIALAGFVALARRVTGGGRSWVWAVTLFGLSGALIEQANLVKHFALDLCFAIALAWLALRAHVTPAPRRTLNTWGALAAVAPWLSYASVFSFAGTSLVLGLRHLRDWDWAQRRAYLRANTAVLISCVALLFPVRAQRTATLLTFWSVGFPDTQSLPRLLYWFVRTHLGLYHYLAQPARALGPVCVAAGVVYWWLHGRRFELVTLWTPIALALAASSVHYWPFGGNQHMSFAAPAVTITVAVGIDVLLPTLRRWHPRAPNAAAVLLLGPALLTCAYHLAVPRWRHEMRPVIQYAQQGRSADDQMVVLDPATYFFYTGIDVRRQALRIEPQQRVWIITPCSKRGGLAPDAQRIVDGFASGRPRLDQLEVHGAAAYLFGPEPEPPVERDAALSRRPFAPPQGERKGLSN